MQRYRSQSLTLSCFELQSIFRSYHDHSRIEHHHDCQYALLLPLLSFACQHELKPTASGMSLMAAWNHAPASSGNQLTSSMSSPQICLPRKCIRNLNSQRGLRDLVHDITISPRGIRRRQTLFLALRRLYSHTMSSRASMWWCKSRGPH